MREKVQLVIAAGPEGEEAELFADHLFKMYSRAAERRGWKLQVRALRRGPGGHLREAICSVEGPDCGSELAGEAGMQRCQRVPPSSPDGRIQTSTALVSCLGGGDATLPPPAGDAFRTYDFPSGQATDHRRGMQLPLGPLLDGVLPRP